MSTSGNDQDKPPADGTTAPPAAIPSNAKRTTNAITGPADQRGLRVFIRQSIARKLVARGTPNDIGSITAEVNRILDYETEYRLSTTITRSDVLAVEQVLVERIVELTASNIALAKLLYDLGAVLEADRIFGTLREIAISRLPKGARQTATAAEVQPANPAPPTQ